MRGAHYDFTLSLRLGLGRYNSPRRNFKFDLMISIVVLIKEDKGSDIFLQHHLVLLFLVLVSFYKYFLS